jgi:hypothetical protein
MTEYLTLIVSSDQYNELYKGATIYDKKFYIVKDICEVKLIGTKVYARCEVKELLEVNNG